MSVLGACLRCGVMCSVEMGGGCLCMCVHVCVCIYVCVHMHVHVCVCACVSACACMCHEMSHDTTTASMKDGTIKRKRL